MGNGAHAAHKIQAEYRKLAIVPFVVFEAACITPGQEQLDPIARGEIRDEPAVANTPGECALDDPGAPTSCREGAVKLTLEWLGEDDLARSLEDAIAGVIADGVVRTFDMGGDAGTMEMAQAVAERL